MYKNLEEAIRDGWSVSVASGNPWWWGDLERKHYGELAFHMTARKGDYFVELGGNFIDSLILQITKFTGNGPWPGAVQYTRGWWGEKISQKVDAAAAARRATL